MPFLFEKSKVMIVIYLWLVLVLQIGLFVAVAVLAYKLRARFRFQDRQFQNLNSVMLSQVEKRVLSAVNQTPEAILNGISLAALDFQFPVFLGEASIDSFHARYLIQRLVLCEPRLILELGSGASSVLLAKVMRRISPGNFVCISVDHDERYLALSRRYAELNGVAESIIFHHCPLEVVPGLGTSWYSQLPELLVDKRIDFLLVDGPPAYMPDHGLARYPALPALYKYLAVNCTIILDDANRPGEQAVINRWLKEFPEFVLTSDPRGKGIAMFSRPANRI